MRVTGDRHHHVLRQARCSGEPRKCTAWLNATPLAGDVPAKHQIKKLSAQTKANLESAIICLCKGTISKAFCDLLRHFLRLFFKAIVLQPIATLCNLAIVFISKPLPLTCHAMPCSNFANFFWLLSDCGLPHCKTASSFLSEAELQGHKAQRDKLQTQVRRFCRCGPLVTANDERESFNVCTVHSRHSLRSVTLMLLPLSFCMQPTNDFHFVHCEMCLDCRIGRETSTRHRRMTFSLTVRPACRLALGIAANARTVTPPSSRLRVACVGACGTLHLAAPQTSRALAISK